MGGDRSTAEAAGKTDAQSQNVNDAVNYLEQGNNGSPESMQEVQTYVKSLHDNMSESDYRQFIDQVYNRVDSDARSGLVSNGSLPDLAINLNAADRQVDPTDTTGAADANFSDMPHGDQVTRLDENGQVQYTYAADNSSGMSFDAQGNAVAFNKSDNGISVTTTTANGEVRTTDYTGVNRDTVNFDPDGSLNMDLSETHRTGEYPFEESTQIGTLQIHPGGGETIHLNEGNSTISRDASGKVTQYEGDSNGQHVSYDGTTWTGLPGEVSTDANGNPVAVQKDANGDVLVTTISPTGEIQSFNHNDVNADSVKTNPDGSVSMDRVDANNNKIGTVTIAPGGQETTHFDEGNTTIVRDQANGNITKYESDANGKHVSFDGTTWSGLPGRTAVNTTMSADVQIDSNTGEISSYNTNDGVKVSLNGEGEPVKYENTANTGGDNQFSFEYHESDNAWYYHQTNGDYVHIDIPTVNDDGTISSKENGGINSGRDHKIEGAGQESSSGNFFSATLRNVAYSYIDSNVAAIPNIIGDLTGNEGLANWTPGWFTPVDPENATPAERAGGLFGSTIGLFSPGKVSKIGDVVDILKNLGKDAVDQEKGGFEDAVKNGESLNPLENWNWYKWYTN